MLRIIIGLILLIIGSCLFYQTTAGNEELTTNNDISQFPKLLEESLMPLVIASIFLIISAILFVSGMKKSKN